MANTLYTFHSESGWLVDFLVFYVLTHHLVGWIQVGVLLFKESFK